MLFLFNVHPFISVTTVMNVCKVGQASSQTCKAHGALLIQEQRGRASLTPNPVLRGLTVPSRWVRMALWAPPTSPWPLQPVLVLGTRPKENLHGQLWRKRTSMGGKLIRLLNVTHLDGWRGVVTYLEQV